MMMLSFLTANSSVAVSYASIRCTQADFYLRSTFDRNVGFLSNSGAACSHHFVYILMSKLYSVMKIDTQRLRRSTYCLLDGDETDGRQWQIPAFESAGGTRKNERHTHEFGGESGGTPFLRKNWILGIGENAISRCLEGLLALFGLFLVDLLSLSRSPFLPCLHPTLFLCEFGRNTRPIYSKSGVRAPRALPR